MFLVDAEERTVALGSRDRVAASSASACSRGPCDWPWEGPCDGASKGRRRGVEGVLEGGLASLRRFFDCLQSSSSPAEGWFVSQHPEFAAEQAYLLWAYECLEGMRGAARQLQYSIETGAGGTHQARFERDVVEDRAMERLARLQIGGESLLFGRIDRTGAVGPGTGERFYIGRLPVSDKEQNAVIVDWRAPMAESFYRATGAETLGLERRRHFATEAEHLVGIDDEIGRAHV